MLIDKDLHFVPQVRAILQKLYALLYILYRNRHILRKDLKKKLCGTQVLNHVGYADLVYGSCLDLKTTTNIHGLDLSVLLGEIMYLLLKKMAWLNKLDISV